MTMHSCIEGAAEAKNEIFWEDECQQRKQHSEIVTVIDEGKQEKKIIFTHEDSPQTIQECTNKSQQK